ncbi:MAG: ribosome silencing factor [Gammaproteobacteria bacterium]|nr:ribosome silencing factor [Gammaproteobacteria bacterium]
MTEKLSTEQLKALVLAALDDLKAQDVQVIDVRDKASFTDLMIIASGTSDRHIKALADNVVEAAKKHGAQPLGVEGETSREWVLVDLGDIIVHVMHPQTRAFYNLEKLWSVSEEQALAGRKGQTP